MPRKENGRVLPLDAFVSALFIKIRCVSDASFIDFSFHLNWMRHTIIGNFASQPPTKDDFTVLQNEMRCWDGNLRGLSPLFVAINKKAKINWRTRECGSHFFREPHFHWTPIFSIFVDVGRCRNRCSYERLD